MSFAVSIYLSFFTKKIIVIFYKILALALAKNNTYKMYKSCLSSFSLCRFSLDVYKI